jgi:hypothetical protein
MMAKRKIQKQKRSGYYKGSVPFSRIAVVAFKDHAFAHCGLLGSDPGQNDLKLDNDATRVHGHKKTPSTVMELPIFFSFFLY